MKVSKVVVAAAFAAAMVATLATPVKADHPDGDGPSSCSELRQGDTADTANGEHCICAYHSEVNDYLWDVADFLYDDEDESDDDETDTDSAYTHLTRSRIEHLADGLHTGADDSS